MHGGDNRAIVRRFWREVFDGGELDVADELFASDHTIHHPTLPEDGRGPEIIKAFVGVVRKMSPELRVTVEDEIAEDEKVVTLWSARGRAIDQEGPDDPGIVVSGIAIHRVSDGEIQETWLRFQSHDQPRRRPKDAALRRQLGGERRFTSLGEASSFGVKCWFRPRTCS